MTSTGTIYIIVINIDSLWFSLLLCNLACKQVHPPTRKTCLRLTVTQRNTQTLSSASYCVSTLSFPNDEVCPNGIYRTDCLLLFFNNNAARKWFGKSMRGACLQTHPLRSICCSSAHRDVANYRAGRHQVRRATVTLGCEDDALIYLGIHQDISANSAT